MVDSACCYMCILLFLSTLDVLSAGIFADGRQCLLLHVHPCMKLYSIEPDADICIGLCSNVSHPHAQAVMLLQVVQRLTSIVSFFVLY